MTSRISLNINPESQPRSQQLKVLAKYQNCLKGFYV